MAISLPIEDDVVEAAQRLAEERHVPIGEIVSELARKELGRSFRIRFSASGFPIVDLPQDAPPVTMEDVRLLEDEL